MKRTLIGIALLFLFVSTFTIGCSQNPKENVSGNKTSENKLKIITTLFPIEDFTKKIGGSHVDVISIIPPGSNAHTYEPTTRTMIEIADGDAFIFNSKSMEPYANKIADALKNENVKMVEAANGIDMIKHNEDHNEELQIEDDHKRTTGNQNHDEHDHGDADPHVWLDPILSIIIAENIKNTLIELDPENAKEFENNFIVLKKQLQSLDGDFKALVNSKRSPKILVSHAGFGYWEKRYGIEQISITGLSSTNEPSQQQLQEIIDIAKEHKIEYIIFEQNITPKVAEIIKNEIQAKPLRIHNLSVLTEDDVKNDEDYFSLMKENIETLNIALK